MKRILVNILIVLLIVLIVGSLLCLAVYRFYKIFPTLLDRWGLLAFVICGILFVGCWILYNIATKRKWIWLLEFLHWSPSALAFFDRKRVLFPEARAFLENEKEVLRQLTHSEVAFVNITFDSGSNVRIEKPELILTFKKYLPGYLVHLSLPDAVLEYGNKAQQLRLEIHTVEDTLTYSGFIEPKGSGEIILSLPEGNDYGGICLHGLKRWLDEDVLQNEDHIREF
jgi:hypothetical protein